MTATVFWTIVLIAALFGLIWYIWSSDIKSAVDVNKDGKVDTKDLKQVVTKAVEEVNSVTDLNKDGKVDAADAAVIVEKVKRTAKKTAAKVKTASSKKKTKV